MQTQTGRPATIRILDLQVNALVGIYEHERIAPQPVQFDIEFKTDIADAVASDDIQDAVDYDTMCRQVVESVERSDCFLVERLASDVLELVVATPGVSWARVRLRKPQALDAAKTVELEVASEAAHEGEG